MTEEVRETLFLSTCPTILPTLITVIKQTILTLDGKKIKRTIQHIGQGFDSHITYNGLEYDVVCVENDIETGDSTWKCVESKKLGRFPNI